MLTKIRGFVVLQQATFEAVRLALSGPELNFERESNGLGDFIILDLVFYTALLGFCALQYMLTSFALWYIC